MSLANSKVAIIIPARFNSSRFPGKSLEMIDEYNVIQSVYLRACGVKSAQKVIVATDDVRIMQSIENIGGVAVMTRLDHKNGTSRIAEVAEGMAEIDYVINLQGDEPFINPKDIENLINELVQSDESIISLKKWCHDEESLDPNIVKVVTDIDGNALYLSRSRIPFSTDTNGHGYFKHIGIYGFKRDVLLTLVNLDPTPLEMTESLEQLRWLENGYQMKMLETKNESLGIDIPNDLIKAREIAASVD